MPPRRLEGPGEQSPLTASALTIGDAEFEAIRKLVKAKTGISLGLHKRDLVVSRLARRLRSLGLADFRAYVDYLGGDDGTEMVQMINRITTNKTDFFREKHHFEYLTRTLLPDLAAAGEASGKRVLRAWSAGCSSGEEPYSIAITLREFFANRPGWDVKLLATDLDTSILEKASRGEYEAAALEPVPPAPLNKYFERQGRGDDARFSVKPELRSLITFRKFNLMHPEYPIKVPLDFVFCRNVLIYFEQEDKLAILRKFHKVIKPNGHIFVGHSESLMMAKDLFRYVATTVYQKI